MEDILRLKIKKIKRKWNKYVTKCDQEVMLSFFYNHHTKHISEFYRHRGIELTKVERYLKRKCTTDESTLNRRNSS